MDLPSSVGRGKKKEEEEKRKRGNAQCIFYGFLYSNLTMPASLPGLLKVRKYQYENRKLLYCPKYERKIWKILPLILRAEFFNFFRVYFGQCDGYKFSFWNFLTFTTILFSFEHFSAFTAWLRVITLVSRLCVCLHLGNWKPFLFLILFWNCP